VTLAFIAPYKCSYLLTYLLTYLFTYLLILRSKQGVQKDLMTEQVNRLINALQCLMAAREKKLLYLDMHVNVKKSTCIRFGARYNADCACLSLVQGKPIQWSSHCRYLGVYFASGRAFKCSFDRSKCQFFKSLNAIFSKVGRFASEEVVLKLLRAKCLPVLLYGVESCLLLVLDKRSLEFTVTRSFMKLFRTGSAAVVNECQNSFVSSQLHTR